MNPTNTTHIVVYTPFENAILNTSLGSTLLTWGICLIVALVLACKIYKDRLDVGPFKLFGTAAVMGVVFHYLLIFALMHL